MSLLALRRFELRAPSGLCEVCREWATQRVCPACVAEFAPSIARCRRCAVRLPGPADVCGSCLRAAPPFERAVSAVDYAFPWDRLIVELKFKGEIELAQPLAQRMIAAVRAAGAASDVDLVVPVPLARRRLAERGFNQAWEVARRAAKELDLATSPGVLLRPLETAHQADLPRDRRAMNLRGAFMVDPHHRAQVRERRIALVDDVMTTGATAREAAAALLRAGACAVQVWTVARTA